MSLVKPDGIIGLLTPSGIYADKTAAPFFKSVSTAGRVACVFDFENKKIFFPDVHASFKFCALIFGGEERTFPETHCAFFLHDIATIDDPQRCFPLTPDDFARVNPNTGTAPVFRNRKDAEITRRIYEHHPVLVDHTGDKERRAWPVRYNRMFDMTNDSGLFRTREELEEREGAYPIGGNRFNSPSGEWLPLYQGRMIWQFDHRANSVRINPQSTHNPYLSEEVSAGQHADPDFLPQPQYYVPCGKCGDGLSAEQRLGIGFPRNYQPDQYANHDCRYRATRRFWQQFAHSVAHRRRRRRASIPKGSLSAGRQFERPCIRFCYAPKSARSEFELVHHRATPGHLTGSLRVCPIRPQNRPRSRPRSRVGTRVHRA